MAGKKRSFIAVLLLLIVFFIIGALIGRGSSNSELSEITQFIKHNELNAESYIIEQALMSEFGGDVCGLLNQRLNEFSLELYDIGKRLSGDNAEKELGSDNYNFLKRKYHLMQIRAYIMFRHLVDECKIPQHVVLFYFSRNDPSSREQGTILDELVKNYKVVVFAIEYNYSSELKFLEEYYNVTTSPTLVIDYSSKKSGLTPYEKLEQFMK
jgi:hypothetical protein